MEDTIFYEEYKQRDCHTIIRSFRLYKNFPIVQNILRLLASKKYTERITSIYDAYDKSIVSMFLGKFKSFNDLRKNVFVFNNIT